MENYNRLSGETSPYLLQHASNPVNWYPWGNEAFETAKRENKLMLMSIGYSSCHWCHVMERESFTDPEVANIMNRYYICVKVDREEHPEVDQLYMHAVQIITGRGGWPLNCFTLPDGRPVFGGTYFTKESWMGVLESLNSVWRSEPERVVEVAEDLSGSVALTETVVSKPMAEIKYNSTLEEYVSGVLHDLDARNGGTRGAPKFPMPGFLDFLLLYGQHAPLSDLKDYVYLTLNKLANGGIYDHLGGGFARYSVDEYWHVPHFEKMLYDNAQLISLYSKAFRLTQHKDYRQVVYQTIEFLERELKSPSGSFYASLDADSDGREGAYYVWAKQEIETILGEHAEVFCAAYDVSASGNWEGVNVLRRDVTIDQLAELFGLPPQTILMMLDESRVKLFEHRGKRSRPGLDDKIIASWNALLIDGLVDAYLSFDDLHFLQLAEQCAHYLVENHIRDGLVKRISCKGKITVNGLLDDYAFTIKAFLSLYAVTLNPLWLNYANSLMDYTLTSFYDEKSGMFFYTEGSSLLALRKMELLDGVIPSSSSVMARNMVNLSRIGAGDEYLKIAFRMVNNTADNTLRGGQFVYGWAGAMLSLALPGIRLGVEKNNAQNVRQIMGSTVHPQITVEALCASPYTEDAIQLCVGSSCTMPQGDLQTVIQAINGLNLRDE
jgi:hypothetical protein